MRSDEELQAAVGVTIAVGSVLSNGHSVLLPKNTHKKSRRGLLCMMSDWTEHTVVKNNLAHVLGAFNNVSVITICKVITSYSVMPCLQETLVS